MQNSKKAGRSWLYGAMFVWALTGAVAYATYSSKPATPEGKLLMLDDKPLPQGKLLTMDDKPSSEEPLPPLLPLTAEEAKALTPTGPQIEWEGTFEAAMQRARLEKKPIMIDFYTDWCTWCKELDRQVFPAKPVIKEAKNWISIRLNAEKRPDVAGAYGVTGFPTIVFAQPTGRPLLILPGYAPSGDFVGAMREARSKWKPNEA